MRQFSIPNINTPEYWDEHQTALDFGLRQMKYAELAGTGHRIVELGCGLSPFLSKVDFREKYGIDFSKKTIERAKLLYRHVRYFARPATATGFKDAFFDVVVAGELIEHLEKPEELIEEMFRICKSGGKVILSTPHLEFDDKEHLWEFDVEDLFNLIDNVLETGMVGLFNQEIIRSERFPGREYIFICVELL